MLLFSGRIVKTMDFPCCLAVSLFTISGVEIDCKLFKIIELKSTFKIIPNYSDIELSCFSGSSIIFSFDLEQTLMFLSDRQKSSFKTKTLDKNKTSKCFIQFVKTKSLFNGAHLFSDFIWQEKFEKNAINWQNSIATIEKTFHSKVIPALILISW